MTATTVEPTRAVTARAAGALPWVHDPDVFGARVRTLWESPGSRAVLLLLDRGAHVPLHVHAGEEHHAFVLDGWCAVGDQVYGEGSYLHTDPGVPHDVRGDFPFGATILYVFHRSEP